MKIYQLAREFSPFANAGGLKEVVSGLAESLYVNGFESSVFIPAYGFIDKTDFHEKERFLLPVKGENMVVTVYYKDFNGINLYLMENPLLMNKRSVYTYTSLDEQENSLCKRGEGFSDNNEINLIFQLSFLYYIFEFLSPPDVVLLHDGHTGLIPGIIETSPEYNSYFEKCRLLFIIHNAGLVYHQRVDSSFISQYKIISQEILDRVTFQNKVDPLCLGVLKSCAITVSPFYAKELHSLVHEETSGGFGEFCNRNGIVLKGITNGVNTDHYGELNVEIPPSRAEKKAFGNKAKSLLDQNKSIQVWGELILEGEKPLFLFQNRITEQKGIDKYISSVKDVLDRKGDAAFIVMGQGEISYEEELIVLAGQYPSSFCFIQGYDETIAKNLFLYSDFFILTSLWEPCGLTDFEAQMAGSIPVVNATGGLKKVINNSTGFVYKDFRELPDLIFKCIDIFNSDRAILEDIISNAVRNIRDNYTWDKVLLNNYLPLFKAE